MPRIKKLKVLLIPPDYWSGIGAMARHLACSVKGVDFYFFTTTDIKHNQEEFLRLVSSVDIVHWLANLSWTKFPPGIDIRKFSVPNIATVHHVIEGLAGSREKEEATKISEASHAEVIQVVSKEWMEFVQKRTKTPVYLAHHAINPSHFKQNRIKERPGKPFQIGTFGFARELKDRKRIDVLLETLTVLKKENYSFELIVQGPYWNNLQKHFIEQGINVKSLGYLSSMQALKSYRFLDLYVCSSDTEGGPLPVLEALASGVPVVSTRVGVAIEALSKGGGILVDKGDSAQMARAIATIMDNSTLYQQLANEAILVSEDFSWGKIGKEYLTIYQFALTIKKPTHAKKISIGSAKMQRSIQLSKSAIKEFSFLRKMIRVKHFIGETFRKLV